MGRALTANVGEAEIAVMAIVYLALAITGMTIESVGIEGMVLTSFNTFKALGARLMEAEFLIGPGGLLQSQIRYQTSEAAGAAFFSDNQVMDAKSSDACHIRHMSVGPVAHQIFLVKVVGCWDQGRPMSRGHQFALELFVDIRDELVGFQVSHCPAPGAIAFCLKVFPIDPWGKGKKVCHHTFRSGQQFSGSGVA